MLSVFRDKRGVTALEYAVLAAILVVAVSAAIGTGDTTTGIGKVINDAFTKVSGKVNDL
jgi:Flp/Fap pilin component.